MSASVGLLLLRVGVTWNDVEVEVDTDPTVTLVMTDALICRITPSSALDKIVPGTTVAFITAL